MKITDLRAPRLGVTWYQVKQGTAAVGVGDKELYFRTNIGDAVRLKDGVTYDGANMVGRYLPVKTEILITEEGQQ